MGEQLPTSLEQGPNQSEVTRHAVEALATEFHEDWRKTRLDENGAYEPRVKQTADEAWVEAHGTDQVDIANTEYADLPADWQAENKAAAEVVVGIMVESDGNVDLNNEEVRNNVGNAVHDAWLSRNEWAKDGELGVPFEQLPADEQAKDISQVEVAQRLFS